MIASRIILTGTAVLLLMATAGCVTNTRVKLNSLQPQWSELKAARDAGEKVALGPDIEIAAVLRKPEGDGPFPAVVLLHGCGGYDRNGNLARGWMPRIVRWGFVALAVDSLRPRGVKSTCGKFLVNPRERVFDAYGALRYLKTLPYVDAEKVVLIGWSHGGAAALKSMETSVTEPMSDNFSGAIAFYPSCYELSALSGPVLILAGEKDDWPGPGNCDRLEALNDGVELTIYPNAYHGFDCRGLFRKRMLGHILACNTKAYWKSIEAVKGFLEPFLTPAPTS